MKNLKILLLSVLLILPLSGSAVTVRGLYEADVPVTDQSSAQRNTAIRSAFIQIMVKLTGNRNAGGIYGVSDLLENATQYVQQYEYRNKEDEATGSSSTQLWIKFDPGIIDKGMREYNIPVWSQERPSTLIWLVIKDDLGQRFASLDENSRYFSVLNEQARARGIQFITPLYDLQDASAIKSSDVMDGLEGQIQLASERYQPDAILAGAIIASAPGLWEGRWFSSIQGQVTQWSNSGDSIELVLSEGMDGQADNLAARFADTQGFVSESNQEIRVNGIANFEQYARTLRYLETLNFVSGVDVKSVDHDQVVYLVSIRGSENSLSQALSLGRILEPSGAVNEYRFVP